MRSLFGVGMSFLIAWLCSGTCKSQGNSLGARSAGLAGISVVSEDVWALSNNPAGLGRLNHIAIATSCEQRFLMKELGRYALGLTIPKGNGCFGLNSISSGYRYYIDQQISLGYGRFFGNTLITGLSLIYVYQKAGEQSSPLHQLSYQFGAIAQLSDKLSLGFSAFNPFNLYWKNRACATLPGNIRLGISYMHSPILVFLVECEKDYDFPPWIKAGFELNKKEMFFIRGGIRLFPVTYSFGAGFRYFRYCLDVSSVYHQFLGFTPHISFQYDLK